MTKIAFVDIDGTVLDYSKNMNKPSDNTLLAFKKFRENGNILIIATSRSRLPLSLNKEDYDGFVLNNGQYISVENKVLLDNIFSLEQINFLVELFKNHQAGGSFQGANGSWVSPSHKDLAIKHMVHYGFNIADYDKFISPFNVEDIQASAITATFEDAKLMKEVEDQLPSDWEIHAYYDPNDLRIDIHLPGHTKSSSCMKVVETLKLNHEDSYAIGDGINDIEMLESVGCGIAMGNAEDKVKAIADVITDDLFNDGLAKAFDKLFELDLNIK